MSSSWLDEPWESSKEVMDDTNASATWPHDWGNPLALRNFKFRTATLVVKNALTAGVVDADG